MCLLPYAQLLYLICHTDLLPFQWFMHPKRLERKKTFHPPWMSHANCMTFLNKSICLYPPSADFCWSQRKDGVSRRRAWRLLAVMLIFTSLPNSVSCVWERRTHARTLQIGCELSRDLTAFSSWNHPGRTAGPSDARASAFVDLWSPVRWSDLAHKSSGSTLICSCSNDLQAELEDKLKLKHRYQIFS